MTLDEALQLADSCVTPAPERAHQALVLLTDEVRRRQKDAARIDWLADRENQHGFVTLPTACILPNIDDMRAAIDAAMSMQHAERNAALSRSGCADQQTIQSVGPESA